MTEKDFCQKLENIDPSKECLKFLAKRVLSKNYRGMQISQHNRYTVDDVVICLDEINKLVGKNLMRIRTRDLSKRPENTPEEKTYAECVTNISKRMARCTQDSLRKNLFVDFHRMGFINRFDKNKQKVAPYKQAIIHYVCLTDFALELLENQNHTFAKNFIYTKAIDKLTKGLANELFEILTETGGKTISIWEFMFFISFMNCDLNGHLYSRSEVSEFAKEFSAMSKFQKEAVIAIVAEYCEPNNFKGNKTDKRDFHNWKNESQQIFMLMEQTVLFEQNKEKECLEVRVGTNAVFSDSTKLKRSAQAKLDYFSNHSVVKKIGFELHHVIPLLLAKDVNEFSALDVWQNLIYIDAYTHSKISQSGNKTIKLDFSGNDATLQDPAGLVEKIICKYKDNLEYNTQNQGIMQTYNENTLSAWK